MSFMIQPYVFALSEAITNHLQELTALKTLEMKMLNKSNYLLPQYCCIEKSVFTFVWIKGGKWWAKNKVWTSWNNLFGRNLWFIWTNEFIYDNFLNVTLHHLHYEFRNWDVNLERRKHRRICCISSIYTKKLFRNLLCSAKICRNTLHTIFQYLLKYVLQ